MKAATVIGAFAFIALAARPAYPCGNEVMRSEEAIKLVMGVEQALEKADYKAAQSRLATRRGGRMPSNLRDRLEDAQSLITLRTRTAATDKETLGYIAEHFAERAKSKDVKFKAWLAEAYEAVGKTEQALQILDDLKKRDLMPDAFAYVTLARLSSKAEDRDAALAACKTRAKTKSICTVQAKTETAAKS